MSCETLRASMSPTCVTADVSVWMSLIGVCVSYCPHRSQESGERVLHIAIPALMCGSVFALFPTVTHMSVVSDNTYTARDSLGTVDAVAPKQSTR